MYATLRYNQRKDTPIRVERQQVATASNSGKWRHHVACQNCREKKVRCSGQQNGCDRCRAKLLSCVYRKSSDGAQASSIGEREIILPDHSVLDTQSSPPSVSEIGALRDQSFLYLDTGIVSDQLALSEVTQMSWAEEYLEGLGDMSPVTTASSLYSGPLTKTSATYIPGPDSDRPIPDSDPIFFEPGPCPVISHSFSSQSSYLSSPSRTPNVSSANLSRSSSASQMIACSCLPDVMEILIRLEGKDKSPQTPTYFDQSSLAVTLAFQRYLMERCSAMLDCGSCRFRSQEFPVMMGWAVERLVAEHEQLHVVILNDDRGRQAGIPKFPEQQAPIGYPALDGSPESDKGWRGKWPIGEEAYQSFCNTPAIPSPVLERSIPNQNSPLTALLDSHAQRLGEFIDRFKLCARVARDETALGIFLQQEKRLHQISS